jgi:outer membrane lipoprotein-sorting protein
MKRTRHILLTLLAVAISVAATAQTTAITGAQRAEVLSAIAAAQQPKAGKTLAYNFLQTKHSPLLAQDAVSKGSLVLGNGRSMRWQYTEPQAFALVVEGAAIYTIAGGKRNTLTGASGKMTRGLAQMMMQMTDGASLTNEKMFETTLAEEGSTYRITLVPKRRDMKRMMQQALLTFDHKTLRIKSVRLVEGNDSYTQIDFTQQ